MTIKETVIEEALRSEDIESLFQHGAPDDEYKHEAQSIADAIAPLGEKNITEEQLVKIISTVWIQAFGPFSDEEVEVRMPAFRQVAYKILSHD
jgi:hypothetical protein